MSRKIDLIASVLAGEKPGSLARLSARRLVDALEALGYSIVPTPAPQAPSVPQGEGIDYIRAFRDLVVARVQRTGQSFHSAMEDEWILALEVTPDPIPGSAIASPVEGDDAGSRSALPDASRQELLAQTLLNIARDYDARWRGKEGRGPIPLAELHPGGQRYWREKAALIEAALGASPRPATKEPEQETYYLSAPIPPKGKPQSWDCVYCGRPPTDHGVDKRCPPRRAGDQPEGGE